MVNRQPDSQSSLAGSALATDISGPRWPNYTVMECQEF